MKVFIDHQMPFFLAHGGFQIQIEQTYQALASTGVDVEWTRWWDDSQKPDIIHFFGKPDSYYLKFAREKGIKIVLSELLTGLGSRTTRKQQIQGNIIGLSKKYCRSLASRMNWDSYNYIDAIVALTPYEAGLFRKVFHAPSEKLHIIPNGVDGYFLGKQVETREDWLLCTAAIHPRKRVLEMVLAASDAQTPLRIYGKPYSEEDLYFQKFLDAVKDSRGIVQWFGSISDRAELAALYRKARGFILLSTMESLSLSALEAAATGCPLLLSELPWATSTFGDHATYAPNTSEVQKMAPVMRSFYENPHPVDGYHVYSWLEIAEQLKSLYHDLLR